MNLRNIIQKRQVFKVSCSVNIVTYCDEEYEFDGPTVKDVEREMIAEGWLDDLIIEDSIHLGCPSCVEYLREHVEDFEELDKRVRETAYAAS